MEPASLAISILPLAVGALKAYRTVYDGLRTFRHYSHEVKRIFTKLHVQQELFASELQTLLAQVTEKPEDAASMLVETDHAGWQDKSLSTRLRSCLRKEHEVYCDLIDGIRIQLEKFQSDLACFDKLLEHRKPEERIKHTIVRVKSAVRITFDKSRLEGRLNELRQDNEDLRRVTFNLNRSQAKGTEVVKRKALPKEIIESRDACRALYDSLEEFWCCSDPQHDDHFAKLLLETKTGDGVGLDLALSCSSNSDEPLSNPPLWLFVRTLTESEKFNQGKLESDSTRRRRPSFLLQADAASERPNKRVKLTQKPGAAAKNRQQDSVACESSGQCLCLAKKESCLDFIEAEMKDNYSLRQVFRHNCPQVSRSQPATRLTSLASAIGPNVSPLSYPQQLAIANKLAMAVLCLNSTPWLQDQWRTRDISSFTANADDEEDFLRSLHVTTKISQKTKGKIEDSVMSFSSSEEQCTNDESDEAQLLYGVPNIMLFSLGVALLEIAHQQPLESFRLERDANDIITARRLAQRAPRLGQKYQRLAQRCLQCDFGCGSDLGREELQGAVYSDVVGKLGEMLEGFKM